MKNANLFKSFLKEVSQLQRNDSGNLILPNWMYSCAWLIIDIIPIVKQFTNDNIDYILDEIYLILRTFVECEH